MNLLCTPSNFANVSLLITDNSQGSLPSIQIRPYYSQSALVTQPIDATDFVPSTSELKWCATPCFSFTVNHVSCTLWPILIGDTKRKIVVSLHEIHCSDFIDSLSFKFLEILTANWLFLVKLEKKQWQVHFMLVSNLFTRRLVKLWLSEVRAKNW